MMHRFCVDESTGQAVADHLRARGYDVWSVIESSSGMADREIIHQAYNEKRVLVSNDKDFGELIFRKRIPAVGSILLRLVDESPSNKVRVVKAVLDRWSNSLEGYYITATDYTIRRRKLPDFAD